MFSLLSTTRLKSLKSTTNGKRIRAFPRQEQCPATISGDGTFVVKICLEVRTKFPLYIDILCQKPSIEFMRTRVYILTLSMYYERKISHSAELHQQKAAIFSLK